MNICLVYPGFPPYYQFGGISTLAYEYARQLSLSNEKVTVLSRVRAEDITEPTPHKNDLGISLLFLPEADQLLERQIPEYAFSHYGAGIYSRLVRDVIQTLEKERGSFDIIEFADWGGEGFHTVHAHPWKTVVRCSTPAFISEIDNADNPPSLENEVKLLERGTLAAAKNIICNSATLMNSICDAMQMRLNWARLPIPISGSDIAKKTIASVRTSFSKNNRMRLLYAGRIERRKGVDLLISAQDKLEKEGIFTEIFLAGATTPLLGGGDSIEKFRSLDRPHIHFLGHVPRADLLKDYSSYDLFCLPSRFESFGYVGAEAMLARVPTVLSDVAGLAEYCTNRVNAYLFENENLPSLVQTIGEVYNDYPRAMQIADRGQALAVREFGAEAVVKKNVEHYKTICSRARECAPR